MKSSFVIRRSKPEDFESILELLGQLWPGEKLDRRALKKVSRAGLASNSQVYLCATDRARVVAFASLTIKNNVWQAANLGHVDELIVDQRYRRRGLGNRLLECIAAVARKRGCARLELDSAFHRRASHRFYQQHGFDSRACLFSKPLA